MVALTRLKTLWFNTGSLCNLACFNCYMDSNPKNDSLVYLSAAEVSQYLDEAADAHLPLDEAGFTGGEPFMNREFPAMLEDALTRGLKALVLTNGLKPLANRKAELLELKRRFGDALTLRVSMDHYEPARHEEVRGEGTWETLMDNLAWLGERGFKLSIAGRTLWNEPEDAVRAGYGRLFAERGIAVDADDASALILFPEMDVTQDVPEITVNCWSILGIHPDAMMCATSRMVIRRKGGGKPVVVPCTLLPYEQRFELGSELGQASAPVKLNHPHCAKFCVLGGGSCSVG